jgi:hypothetical protein
MIKHIVMWKLNNVQDALRIKARLDALPPLISAIVDFEVGIDVNRSDAAFDIVLYSSFRSKEDLNSYSQHPSHREVAQFIGGLVQNRHVVDYEV